MTPKEVIVRELERDICYPENGANEDAILAALDAAGYVIVPKEPTDEMRVAALEATFDPERGGDRVHARDVPLIYRAMISAHQ